MTWLRLAALALALAAAPPARPDGYDEALAAARREAAGGRWASAARLLEAPARSYPQDYPVQLERAWCLFQAGELGPAERAYEQARALAPEAPEPWLGLAWTALRREEAARARRLFGEVLARSSGNGSAREGLALLGPEHRGSVALLGGYAARPDRPAVGSGTLALEGLLADRLALGGLYRALGSASSLGSGRGRAAGTSPALQHEAHAHLGWAGAGWSATLHGGWSGQAAGTEGGVPVVRAEEGALAGASAGLRPGAGLTLEGSLLRTFYRSGDVTQWQAIVGLALAPGLVLRGGARGQGGAGNGLAGLASLELAGRWSAWLAAELGSQRRPVDLAARAIYAVDDPLRWAARAGLGFPLGGALTGLAALDLEAWAPSGSGTDLGWRGSAGLRLAF